MKKGRRINLNWYWDYRLEVCPHGPKSKDVVIWETINMINRILGKPIKGMKYQSLMWKQGVDGKWEKMPKKLAKQFLESQNPKPPQQSSK